MEATIAPENLRNKWDVYRRTSFITSTSADAPRLEFYVKKGINLASRDNYDPFLVVWSFNRASPTSDNYTSRKLKSKPAKSSPNPEWKEVFEISVSCDENGIPIDTITIYVWDRDNSKMDDFMGCADIPLTTITREKENVLILPLEGVESGQLEIVAFPHNFGKEEVLDNSKIEISAYFNSSLVENLAVGKAPTIKNVSSFLSNKKKDSNKINNRYTIVKNLEKGGFGLVYLVKDEKTGEEKALKKIMCKTLEDANRAIKEAWPFKSLVHENLVLYEDMFLDVEQHMGDVSFYVCYIMPYYKQGDLYQLLEGKQKNKPRKYLKPVVLANWIVQIAKGIEHLHSYKVFHRDLKHKNIFFTEQYKQLKIGDFGFAKQVEEGKAYTQLGSAGYIAPEIQTSSSGYGLEVDIWSFAVMCYEMMTLKIGKEQVSHAILAQFNFEDYWKNVVEGEIKKAYPEPQIHTPLITFLSKILRVDPKERATASECVRMAREIRQTFAELDQQLKK
ncbi:hypothetical protein C9374_010514 [Naegleria lovaniensis]|uniref:non-specific serine/threonine protein kinase n=1 Tax=Naegleria lovaniensis TaxID=51637 RepID=A0AA88GFZ0_NAELO|nr:uncharacterized protein C9374_010514 [Naegleria lovaniensis]KAG2374770.1 hypothetical protein C9374_010514 [Naegleria lovaniensis]